MLLNYYPRGSETYQDKANTQNKVKYVIISQIRSAIYVKKTDWLSVVSFYNNPFYLLKLYYSCGE